MSYCGDPFQHDIFVSYSHGSDADGEPFLQQWSHMFVRALRQELRSDPDYRNKLGMFFDAEGEPGSRIDPALPLTEQLEAKVQSATLLLVLMSPDYQRSSWCADERAWWLQKQAAIGAVAVGAIALAGTAWWQREQAEMARVRQQSALDEVEQALVLARTQGQPSSVGGDGGGGSGADLAALVAKLEESVRTLSAGVENASKPQASATLAARVYIHIDDESQRTAASAFAAALAQRTLGQQAIVVPGIERINGQRGTPSLRCFRPDECGGEAAELLSIANALLTSPRLELQNQSERYKDKPPRPRHYEIWFGSAPVVPVSSKGTS
ncbi:hypothetical protein [uncultured Azohydromonas sp.]|uniref:hypothetical protein n=1 Tax=uncultured Azohydromonas sp. TaxID=487342 RepID=UPI00260BA900|nr:hypothetical protein [uncultured Azohydromonas sp.]